MAYEEQLYWYWYSLHSIGIPYTLTTLLVLVFLQELVAYEEQLYNDVTRAGGGGLVRKLGGQRAASRVLEDTQAKVSDLYEVQLKHKEKVERTQKDIKWMFTGNWDSLISCEEFVQVGGGGGGGWGLGVGVGFLGVVRGVVAV